METRRLRRLQLASIGGRAGLRIKKISLQVLSSLDKSGLFLLKLLSFGLMVQLH